MRTNIRIILNKQTQRILDIMEIMCIDEEWIHMNELERRLRVSQKTILKDVKLIRRRWNKLVNIQTSTTLGTRFRTRNIATMAAIFNDLFQEQVSLQLLELILLEPGHSFDDYAARLFSSKTTLYRHLQNINLAFRTMGMQIQRTDNRYYIKAENEIDVRHFFACFISELYGQNLREQLVARYPSLTEIIYQEIIEKLKIEEDIEQTYIGLLFYVSVLRESQGFNLAPERQTAIAVDERLLSRLLPFLKTLTEPMIQVAISTVIRTLPGGNPEEHDMIVTSIDAIYHEVFRAIQTSASSRLIHEYSEQIAIVVERKRRYPFDSSVLFNRCAYFTRLFRKENEYVYSLALRCLEESGLIQRENLETLTEELIYASCMMYPQYRLYKPALNLLVISDYSQKSANFILRFLQEHCQALNLEITGTAMLLTGIDGYEDDQVYDVVLSTISHSQYKNQVVIPINDYLTEIEFLDIYIKLYEISKNKINNDSRYDFKEHDR